MWKSIRPRHLKSWLSFHSFFSVLYSPEPIIYLKENKSNLIEIRFLLRFCVFCFCFGVFDWFGEIKAERCWRRSGCRRSHHWEGIIGSLTPHTVRDVLLSSPSLIARFILLPPIQSPIYEFFTIFKFLKYPRGEVLCFLSFWMLWKAYSGEAHNCLFGEFGDL